MNLSALSLGITRAYGGAAAPALLLESSGYLLLESGDRISLE